MAYISGFVVPVPESNRETYVAGARKSWTLFKEYGAVTMIECWEADVPEGTQTSFPMAVQRQPGEKVVFSWIVWPDRDTADRCWASAETDPRWKEMMDMPFDGKRMIWGNFEPVFEGR